LILNIFLYKPVFYRRTDYITNAVVQDKERRWPVSNPDETTSVYTINKDYRIVRLSGNKCSLFFKNKQNKLLAVLEGCQNVFARLNIPAGQQLSTIEKSYLVSFVRAKKYKISADVAADLDVSVVQHSDGREEYLSARQMKRRFAQGLDFVKVSVNKLKAYSLSIKQDSKEASFDLTRAFIRKLNIGENCHINLDIRDNPHIENITVADGFSGNINLSRSGIESVFIGNRCACNLTIGNAIKCFNLQIGDIYSGNLSVSNCCLYALQIGYYSYAEIMLANNLLKKNISIDNSFRGGLFAVSQNCNELNIGNDCKGWLKLGSPSPETGIRHLNIGHNFAGNANVSADESLKEIRAGDKNSGRIDASYTPHLKNVRLEKYYTGFVDFKSSAIRTVTVDYGASGSLNLQNCLRLSEVQTFADSRLTLQGNAVVQHIQRNQDILTYYFGNLLPQIPLLHKIYRNFQHYFD
jgi:hypothetical protein